MKETTFLKTPVCCRCGIDKKEFRRTKYGCSIYGKNYRTHMWGIFKGKTIKIKL